MPSGLRPAAAGASLRVMGRHAEAIGPRREAGCKFWQKPGMGKLYKRLLARVWRRLAKADPENAPTRRPTRGWAD